MRILWFVLLLMVMSCKSTQHQQSHTDGSWRSGQKKAEDGRWQDIKKELNQDAPLTAFQHIATKALGPGDLVEKKCQETSEDVEVIDRKHHRLRRLNDELMTDCIQCLAYLFTAYIEIKKLTTDPFEMVSSRRNKMEKHIQTATNLNMFHTQLKPKIKAAIDQSMINNTVKNQVLELLNSKTPEVETAE